jgi:cytochrome c-type biogenesis protein CcmE
VKASAIVAAAAILGGIGISMYAFVAGATPYVGAKEALSRPNEQVHVAGTILHESVALDVKTGTLTFTLRDDYGVDIPVTYKGGKPGNFDAAPKASVLGTAVGTRFEAREIRTQCPSKYETADPAS